MDGDAVMTGTHFLLGDVAIAEGALAAGCTFFGGYPITPSTEVAERMSQRLPLVGGVYAQMEDELSSMAAIVGASWAGRKSMTATSGPGFSLMMENLGLAIITETPCVVANVQRGGPSTGLPTAVGQSDMMQARWGSHGHYEVIALCPWSVQECFDLTLRAFNLAERLRTPVLVMADAEVAHLTERVVIPAAGDLDVWDRPRPELEPDGRWWEPGDDLVAPMAIAGTGYRVFVESLTHDDRGYPDLTPEGQARLVGRLVGKIEVNRALIDDVVERDVEDADVVVVSYGITARIAAEAVTRARARGIKVGSVRLRTVWPFPEERLRAMSVRLRGFVVPEINLGQIVREVAATALDSCGVMSVPNAGGEIHDPDRIVEAIVRTAAGEAPTRAVLAAGAPA